MKLDAVLNLVEPRWREEFLHFVETGDGDEAFLNYLDNDTNGQQAVEMAFKAQAEAFEELAKELAKTQTLEVSAPTTGRAAAVSASIAKALEGALSLPRDHRAEILRETTRVLEASVDIDQRDELESFVEALEKRLKKAAATA